MGAWEFDKYGNMSNGIYTIAFTDLLIYKNGVATSLTGQPVEIHVADISTLGGKPASDYLTVYNADVKARSDNRTVLNNLVLTDVDTELIETTLTYIGQSCNIITEPEDIEYIPNIRFQNLDYVESHLGARLSVSNGTLVVDKHMEENPCGVQSVNLVQGKYYLLTTNMSGDAPQVDILRPDCTNLIRPYIKFGFNKRVVYADTTGVHKLRFIMGSRAENGRAHFLAPSLRELDINKLGYGEYYTIEYGSKLKTEIITTIPSTDITYSVNHGYEYNDVAFFKDSCTMLKYINATSHKIGYVFLQDGRYKEFFMSLYDTYSGDIDNIDDLLYFGKTGYLNISYEDSTINITRTLDYGHLEIYFDNFTIVPTRTYIFEFYVYDIRGEWWVQLDDFTKYLIPITGDNLTDKRRRMRFTYTAINNTIRFKLRCESIKYDDFIAVGALHGYELDPTVWADITPMELESYSEVIDCKTSSIKISATTSIQNINRHDSEYNSIIGTKYRLDGMYGGCLYRNNSILDFTNRGIIIGDYDVGSNQIDVLHSLYQVSYNRVMMYRDNTNMVNLIAFDTTGNNSLVYSKTPAFIETPQVLPTGLYTTNVSNITQFPLDYKATVLRYITNEQGDIKYKTKPYYNNAAEVAPSNNIGITDIKNMHFTQNINPKFYGSVLYQIVGRTPYHKDVIYYTGQLYKHIKTENTFISAMFTPLDIEHTKILIVNKIGYRKYLLLGDSGNYNIYSNEVFPSLHSLTLVGTNDGVSTINPSLPYLYCCSLNMGNSKVYNGIVLPRVSTTSKLVGDANAMTARTTVQGSIVETLNILSASNLDSITRIKLRG